jgi:hypothetical protein
MAIDRVAFVFGASPGLTQALHFLGASLGEPGEPDLHKCDEELGELDLHMGNELAESPRLGGEEPSC